MRIFLMVNSHYIPQFILRNFYSNNKITYCDLEEKTLQYRNSRSVFSKVGYYPEDIENDLNLKAEFQFANLYHNKIENARHTIKLTHDEVFTLKKYLVVSSIRYKNEYTEEEKELFNTHPNFYMDYDRSLKEILSCSDANKVSSLMLNFINLLKSAIDFDSVKDKKEVNFPLLCEIMNIAHSYIIFAKTREEEKFLIPDFGHCVYFGPSGEEKYNSVISLLRQTNDPKYYNLLQKINLMEYSFFPLSKDMIIIMMNPFYKLFTDSDYKIVIRMPEDCPTLSSAIGFGDKNIIQPPKAKGYGNNKEFIYDIKYLNMRDICHFNSLSICYANRFIGFADISEIQNSIDYTINLGYTKRDLNFLKTNN